jgi:ADP-heptose:LPS heptosyltransferase
MLVLKAYRLRQLLPLYSKRGFCSPPWIQMVRGSRRALTKRKKKRIEKEKEKKKKKKRNRRKKKERRKGPQEKPTCIFNCFSHIALKNWEKNFLND